jgi:hypothetical protein
MVNSKFLHGDLHDIYVNRHKARAKQSCTTTEYRVDKKTSFEDTSFFYLCLIRVIKII